MKIMMDKQREPSIRHYTHSIQISVTIHVNQNRTQLMFDRYKTSVMFFGTFDDPYRLHDGLRVFPSSKLHLADTLGGVFRVKQRPLVAIVG